LAPTLTPSHLASFQRDGFVYVRAEDFWTREELERLISRCNALDRWPDTPFKWMKYYEKNLLKKQPGHENDPEKILQRIENFLPYDPPLDGLLNGSKMLEAVSYLFGERAVIYKDKINYKLPGSDGFKPHQDVAAGWWMYGQSLHISALVTIDDCSAENGALELVRGRHRDGMLSEKWKELSEEVCQQMKWELHPSRPGDIVFFDSFVPHRSGPNMTQHSRRVAYITYGKLSEGDWREKYFKDKRASFPPDIEREPGKEYSYKI